MMYTDIQNQHRSLMMRGSSSGSNLISDSGVESGSSPELNSSDEPPMSRTNQYRKVMKPMLERKRRARINKCLDEIKDIIKDEITETVKDTVKFAFAFSFTSRKLNNF